MKKWEYHCAILLYVCLGVAGVLLTVTNTFELKYQRAEVIPTVLIFAGMITVLFLTGKVVGGIFAWMIPIGSIFVLYLVQREAMCKSFLYIKEKVLTTIENYLKIDLGSGGMQGTADLGMIVFGIAIGLLLAWGVVCMRHSWFPVMLLGISILLPFAVGEIPHVTGMVFCLFVIPGIASEKTGRRFQAKRQSGLIGMALAAVAFGVGSFFPSAQLQNYLQDKKEITKQISGFLEEKSLDFFGEGRGGVSDGEIGGTGVFARDDTEQLVVATKRKPGETIYLQGYIGTVYEDNRWKEGAKGEFESWLHAQGAQPEDVKNFLYEKLSGSVQEETLSIKNIGANKAYKYVPYGGYYTGEDEIVADWYVEGDEKSYEIQYCPIKDFYFLAMGQTETPLERAYSEYVSEYNIEVPKQIEESFWNEVMNNMGAGDIYLVMEQIQQALDKQADYSLRPGKTPDGEDVARYFYFENKKGYCEHFATVATLMLRMKGIPARYVAGYAVKPDRFIQNEEGMYEAVVTGTSAHAWAEAYVQGVGWIPVETTPGYSAGIPTETPEETEIQQPQQNEPQQNVEEEKKTETGQDDTGTNIEEDRTEEEEEQHTVSAKTRQLIFLVIVIIFLAALFLAVGRRVWIFRKRRILRKKGYGERLRDLSCSMFELLVLAGKVDKGEEMDEGFIQKLCEAYPHIEKKEAEQMLEIVYRERFGNEAIKKEEYQMCEKFYGQMKKEVSADITLWKKIWWKHWKGISL